MGIMCLYSQDAILKQLGYANLPEGTFLQITASDGQILFQYFNAILYLRDKKLLPLQITLRNILNVANVDLSEITDPEVLADLIGAADVMKYALIIVSAVPILTAYSFVEKFFEKGVMIGSVKG